MLLMAIAVAWLAALAYPVAIKLGFTESAASKLPNFGLLAGAALGLAACLAESVKQFLVFLSLIFATASVFWFFALVLESLLIHIGGVAERKLYWLPPAAFCSTSGSSGRGGFSLTKFSVIQDLRVLTRT